MKYEDMSDGKLSLAVSKHIDFGDLIVNFNDDNDQVYLCEKDGLFSVVPVGYFSINNPSDIMPIAIEHEISLIRDVSTNDVWEAIGKGWYSCDGFISNINPQCEVLDKNPYQAIAICFLKMMDAKK